MVAYNFKAQFAPLIESGQKNQTIRAERKSRHANPGEKIQLYTGMRTRYCRKLLPDPVCVAVTPIEIEAGAIFLNKIALGSIESLDLAKADGFAELEDFLLFFSSTHGESFKGLLIQWSGAT